MTLEKLSKRSASIRSISLAPIFMLKLFGSYEPPVIQKLSDIEIYTTAVQKLVLTHSYHNQVVERHIEIVTEAYAATSRSLNINI